MDNQIMKKTASDYPTFRATYILDKLDEMRNKLYPIIKPDDLIHVHSSYRRKPHCYEVCETDEDGVSVTDGDYTYSWLDILAVYRFDGSDYKCIWRKPENEL